jgi:predicted ribosome quality control (RQC) complex YloA/Tae2 family protein
VTAIWSELTGRRIDRIDMPAESTLALSLSLPREVLVVRFAAPRSIAMLPKRPHGEPASAFVQRLRKHYAGKRIDGVRSLSESAIAIDLGEKSLVIELAGTGNVVLVEGGAVVGAMRPRDLRSARGEPYAPPSPSPIAIARDLEALRAADVGPPPDPLAERRSAIRRALARKAKSLRTRAHAIEADVARGARAASLRREGSLLLANLHAYAPRSSSMEVRDFETGELVAIAIDPRLGPKGTAEAAFKAARRAERGAEIGSERLAQTNAELARIAELDAATAHATTLAELDDVATRARAQGVQLRSSAEPRAARTKTTPKRLPYRAFRGAGDRPIFVGRGAADNDALTTGAKPSDLWLHARDHTGSHVIVPLGRTEACPSELLVDAATLALHFSAGASEAIGDVRYTPRRYVRKPKGAAVGTVLVEREKVISVRMEPARLARLLASEQKS